MSTTLNTYHIRHFHIATLILVIFLALGTNSVLGMYPHVEFDEVAHSADVIFVGTVTDISTRLTNMGRMVFTDITFENIHLIARQDHVPGKSSQKITLTFAGGRVGDLAVTVSGVPEFKIGQEHLIFARHDGQIYGNPVIGGDQGLFELITDEATGFEYPLAAGRAGIASVDNGKLKKISRVEKVQNGAIQRGARENRMLTPPMSPDGRNHGVTAAEPPTPAKMLTLVEFIYEIHNTLAAGPPDRPVLPIRSQANPGPKKTHQLPGETPEVLGGNDSETPMLSNDPQNPDDESPISTLGGQMLWCGYQDIPIVMEQYPESWEPWYSINNYGMWLYNKVMNIYEITGSDGSFGRDNDESEFCGWITDAQMNRVYGYHWNGALAMCIAHVDTKNCDCCEITEADIMYNPEYSWWEHFADVYNVNPLRVLYRPVTLHELGHSWGLQRPQSAETYDYDRLTVMHSYYNNIIEDGYGIHAVDAELMRDAYDDQTVIIGFHDMGVESYYADNGLRNSTTDKSLYEPGEILTVQNISVENIAFTTQFDIRLRLYLSTDKNITTDDYLMGSYVNWASFSKESTWVGNVSRTIPNDVPTGLYYVGLILTVDGAAYNMDAYPANNITYLPHTVYISCPAPTGIAGVTASDNAYTDKVRVTWTQAEGVANYEVWRYTSNFSPDAERIAQSLGGNLYDDTTAVPGQIYYYWVRGKSICGTMGNFGGSDSGYRAVTDYCRVPPDYDFQIIPSIQWKSFPDDFGVAGCRVYRMYLYKHIGYDFSLCGNDNVGGVYTGDGDGDLTMYDPAGDQLWYIYGFTSCSYDATTIGTVSYDNWSPPTDGDYYLKVSDYANDQFGSYYLAYRASIGDYCWSAPNANDTLVPTPYWQVSDEEQLIAGACRMYRISMSPDNSYDFSLCVNEGVGAFWEGGSEGSLFLYNSSGVQLWEIDARSECDYNASTLGTIREGWSPPTQDDYYLRVIPYSQNSNANYRLAYRLCPNPADPVIPTPDNESSDISLSTNLSWLGILDDFNRPFNHYMGRNWVERSGDFWIAAETARGDNRSVMTFNGVTGNHISVEAQKVDSSTGYVALVNGYADPDNCLFIKIQGGGVYDMAYFYFGENGSNNDAWAGQTMFNIDQPFTSARISTHLEGDIITLEIDTDFDGDTDQTFSRGGVPLHLLGDGIGLGVYGLDSMDNFALTGPAATPSSNSNGEVIDSSSFCYDLGHPTLAGFVADIGSSDRGIAVDINETVEVSALAIKAIIGSKTSLTVKIQQVNSNLLGNFLGPILASETTPVSAGPLDFYEVPIDFTFQKGLRYDISFNVTDGWGNNGDDLLEYYNFDNPTLNTASGFDVGSFRILDGRAKSYSDTKLPHIRVCLAQPCPTTWDLYIGTENPPETIVANNLTGPFYDPTSIPNGMLNSCTTYYWRTVMKNCCGETEGPVWSFTTGDTPPFDPYPQDGEVDVSAHSSLTWSVATPPAPVGGSGEAVEILHNPGFESGELSPWYTEADGDWSISSQYLHSGDFYADSTDDSWIQQDFPPVAVADIYTVNLWSRQPGKNKETAVGFYYQDGSSNYVLLSTSSTWRSFDVTSGLEANRMLTGLRIWDYGADGIDDLTNIDDVSIIAKDVLCQTTYNVYMGTNNPPQILIASDLTEPILDPTNQIGEMLESCQTYYWQVQTINCCGQTLASPVWSFKTAQIGDLDGTRTVGLEDFALFARRWLDIDCTTPDWCDATDIDHSGGNNEVDLLLIVEQWLRTCP